MNHKFFLLTCPSYQTNYNGSHIKFSPWFTPKAKIIHPQNKFHIHFTFIFCCYRKFTHEHFFYIEFYYFIHLIILQLSYAVVLLKEKWDGKWNKNNENERMEEETLK